jgi:hypothetical protein
MFVTRVVLPLARLSAWARTIKHHEFVSYRKLTYFVVSWYLLAWTNTLAYYGVRTLRIRKLFYSTHPFGLYHKHNTIVNDDPSVVCE